jgi:exodeoxyribonuclease V alpha subunit
MARSEIINVCTVLSCEIGKGAIFTGDVLDAAQAHTGARISVVAPWSVIGDNEVFVGDTWRVVGTEEEYEGHPQIRAITAALVRPCGENIIAVLRSKRFPGIGDTKARQLWKQFGADLYGVLRSGDITRLREVLSDKDAETLVAGWPQVDAADVIAWLDENRVDPRLGQKLIAFYGPTARDKLERDPYRLLSFNVPWAKADALAREKLGVGMDDARREHAAVVESLFAAARDGHTAAEAGSLVPGLQKLLGGAPEQAERALAAVYSDGGFVRLGSLLQARGMHVMERHIAARISSMVASSKSVELNAEQKRVVGEVMTRFQAENHALGQEQKLAVWTALNQRICAISGGAGTGKTTILKALRACFAALGVPVVQMALAGRAAQQMRLKTGGEAMTIHRFIKRPPAEALEGSAAIVIDEMSMVDVQSFFAILQHLPPDARLILVGDDEQLPPVGAGLVWHLLCAAGGPVPHVHLSQVFRQAASTGIPQVCAVVREQGWPELPAYSGPGVGVSIVSAEAEGAGETILRLHRELLAAEGGNIERVQILAVTNALHALGTVGINALLHDEMTAGRRPLVIGGGDQGFREGEKIMATLNDDLRGIYNGSIGVLEEVFDSPVNRATTTEIVLKSGATMRTEKRYKAWARARFESGIVFLTEDDFASSIRQAWACTVHKAQGSQWPRIIVPIGPSRMLDKSLVYTAFTRGVSQVVLVGDVDAARAAVLSGARAIQRRVGLAAMLAAMVEKAA